MEDPPSETQGPGTLKRHAAAIIGVAIVVMAVVMSSALSSVWMNAEAVAREDARQADEAARDAMLADDVPHLGWVNVHVFSQSATNATMITVSVDGVVKDIVVINPRQDFSNAYEVVIGDRTVLLNYSFYSVERPNPYTVTHVGHTVHVDEGLHSNVWFDVGWDPSG